MLHFDELLQQLLQKIVLMGATAESMIGTAVRGLIERNKSLFEEVWSKEEDVNSLQIQIDNEAVKLAATHQPVAKDVRFLFVASRIATERSVERRNDDLALLNVARARESHVEARENSARWSSDGAHCGKIFCARQKF